MFVFVQWEGFAFQLNPPNVEAQATLKKITRAVELQKRGTTLKLDQTLLYSNSKDRD